MISWYEGEELKSMNKTVFGDPTEAYMEPDGVTPLDVDEDGITDADEIDPWNSTTEAVVQFIDHFKDDQEMLDGQFNPFIRESTPPVVINIKVKNREEKEWVCFLLCGWQTKRDYAEISIEAIDVAKFYVTATIFPGRIAEFEGEGHEWFVAELDLYFFEVWGKYKVKIEMVDFAGNELDPSYEEKFYGRCGGVLRFLEEMWDFICAVASAIADAVMKALSFLIDVIVDTISWMMKSVLDPILGWIDEWTTNIQQALDLVYEEQSPSMVSVDPEAAALLVANQIVGEQLALFMTIALAISLIYMVICVFLNVFSFLLDLAIGIIVSLILVALCASLSSNENPQGVGTGMSTMDIANLPSMWLEVTYEDFLFLLSLILGVVGLIIAALGGGYLCFRILSGTDKAKIAAGFGVSFAGMALGFLSLHTDSSDESKQWYKRAGIGLSALGLVFSAAGVRGSMKIIGLAGVGISLFSLGLNIAA